VVGGVIVTGAVVAGARVVRTDAGKLLDAAALVVTGAGLFDAATALWVADGVGVTCASTKAADQTGLGGRGVGELDPPPTAEPMMSRISRPTDTPETDRILPRCVCGLPHANWRLDSSVEGIPHYGLSSQNCTLSPRRKSFDLL
jgi:hypothetical protein